MPAGILENDQFGEVRGKGRERAWHRLGKELPEGSTAEEGFKFLGIDWGTELLEMAAIDRNDPTQPMTEDGKFRVPKLIKDPETFMHIRADTRKKLGNVGIGYRPIPNLEMARFADALCGTEKVALETAGSLYNGRRVFCSVKLPKTIEVVQDDVLELYIILSNSHDGSTAFHTYPSSIRPVCTNTLSWSEKDLTRGLRIQHTGTIANKIEKARAVLGLVVVEAEKFEQDIRMVHRLKMSKAEAVKYFDAVYTMLFVGKKAAEKAANEKGDVVLENGDVLGKNTESTIAQHRKVMIERWMQLLEDPRQDIKGIEGTGWAAYNAFSTWSDNERGNVRVKQESDVRIHSNLFGISNLTKKRAWKSMLQLAAK